MMRTPIFALLGASVLLAGCETIGDMAKKETPKPCPQVSVLADASKMVAYRPGRGRDITDIEVEAEIVGFQGECGYTEKGVELVMMVAIDAKRGPADTDRVAEFSYFLAIPAFYPKPEAKAQLPVRIQFPEGINQARHVDEEVTITIPLKEGELGDKYQVFVGLQLDTDQLQRNRQAR